MASKKVPQRTKGEKKQRCTRARSWSLDSNSTITTADETPDLVSLHEHSVSGSVVWEGGSPVEINVPTPSTSLRNIFHYGIDEPCSSNPIDLDLMDDYYKYEKSHLASFDIENSEEKENRSGAIKNSDARGSNPGPTPVAALRNSLCREPSGGSEGLAELPQRFERFEI